MHAWTQTWTCTGAQAKGGCGSTQIARPMFVCMCAFLVFGLRASAAYVLFCRIPLVHSRASRDLRVLKLSAHTGTATLNVQAVSWLVL